MREDSKNYIMRKR